MEDKEIILPEVVNKFLDELVSELLSAKVPMLAIRHKGHDICIVLAEQNP